VTLVDFYTKLLKHGESILVVANIIADVN
jgi:hypothetical protein